MNPEVDSQVVDAAPALGPTVSGSGETSSESATEGSEAANQSADATEGKVEDVESGDAENSESSNKDKNGFQRRIEKVRAKEREAVAAEMEYWKREALKNATAQPQTQAAPAPTTEPTLSQYGGNVEAFTRALVAHNESVRAEQQYKAQISLQYEKSCAEFAKTHPDFAEVRSEFIGVKVAPAVEAFIIESEQSGHLTYHLGKNFEEFERINGLKDPVRQIKELAKLEAKLGVGNGATTQPQVKKPVNTAPKPATPTASTVKVASKSEYEMTPTELIKARNAKYKYQR